MSDKPPLNQVEAVDELSDAGKLVPRMSAA
jgi:hypothetical protein